MPVTALREIKILKALDHPCVINIADMIVVRGRFALSTSVTVAYTLANRSRQRFSRFCPHGLSIHGP